jgi:WD40 repeat protein
MWDIRRKSWIFTYKGHRIVVNSLKFSPDGQWIASGGDDGLVKVGAMILIWESGLSSWQGQRFFLLSTLLIDSGAQECTGLLFGGYWGALTGVKPPGHETDPSHSSSAEVKTLWSCTSIPPYALMAWCLSKHRDSFACCYSMMKDHSSNIPSHSGDLKASCCCGI